MGRRGYVSQRSKPQAPKAPFFKVDMALQIPNIVSDFLEKVTWIFPYRYAFSNSFVRQQFSANFRLYDFAAALGDAPQSGWYSAGFEQSITDGSRSQPRYTRVG